MKTAILTHWSAMKMATHLLTKRMFVIYFMPPIIVTFFYVTVAILLPSVFFSGGQTGTWSVAIAKLGQILDFLLAQVYIFVVLTFLSPFNTMLSQKVDTHLNDRVFSVRVIDVIRDVLRMIGVVFIALSMQFFAVATWWLVARIVGLHNSVVYEAVAFVISAFFIGFSFYDYSLERHKISVFNSLKFAFCQWKIVAITGIIFKTLYWFPYLWEIPYLGIVVAPIFTTVLSTVMYNQLNTTTNGQNMYLCEKK